MLIGPPGSGKTVTWEIAADVLGAEHVVLNPKALSTGELFGQTATHGAAAWVDGIVRVGLAKILKERPALEEGWSASSTSMISEVSCTIRPSSRRTWGSAGEPVDASSSESRRAGVTEISV